MRFRPANAPKLLLAVTSLILLTDCSAGRRPFRMVQFCLSGPQEFSLLKTEFKAIGETHHGMAFEDNSSQAEADLNAIARSDDKLKVAHPTINISVYRGGIFGMSAANFAEAPLQIVAGFNGSDLPAARRFSDEAVRELGRHWRIHEVAHPEEHGAFPLAACP